MRSRRAEVDDSLVSQTGWFLESSGERVTPELYGSFRNRWVDTPRFAVEETMYSAPEAVRRQVLLQSAKLLAFGSLRFEVIPP